MQLIHSRPGAGSHDLPGYALPRMDQHQESPPVQLETNSLGWNQPQCLKDTGILSPGGEATSDLDPAVGSQLLVIPCLFLCPLGFLPQTTSSHFLH